MIYSLLSEIKNIIQ